MNIESGSPHSPGARSTAPPLARAATSVARRRSTRKLCAGNYKRIKKNIFNIIFLYSKYSTTILDKISCSYSIVLGPVIVGATWACSAGLASTTATARA